MLLLVLLSYLTEMDRVAIVKYAGASRVVLPMTSLARPRARDVIDQENDSLSTGGSTAMASCIDLAYEQARKTVQLCAISRVIVFTDVDAIVGPASNEEILKLIEA